MTNHKGIEKTEGVKPRAIVLLSSGLDSTVNLAAACTEFDVALWLSFDYGQRASAREVERSKAISAHYSVNHKVVKLPWLESITSTGLVNRRSKIPIGDDLEIDNLERSRESANTVWVPNRNGVFLNIAAAYAESLNANFVIPGFNAEEARTFPDNSRSFLHATDQALQYSTAKNVSTYCFTIGMTKTEIVRLGKSLDVPFELLWPCYFSGEQICGNCESCLRYDRAIRGANSEKLSMATNVL